MKKSLKWVLSEVLFICTLVFIMTSCKTNEDVVVEEEKINKEKIIDFLSSDKDFISLCSDLRTFSSNLKFRVRTSSNDNDLNNVIQKRDKMTVFKFLEDVGFNKEFLTQSEKSKQRIQVIYHRYFQNNSFEEDEVNYIIKKALSSNKSITKSARIADDCDDAYNECHGDALFDLIIYDFLCAAGPNSSSCFEDAFLAFIIAEMKCWIDYGNCQNGG
jgi:hypothetical protein